LKVPDDMKNAKLAPQTGQGYSFDKSRQQEPAKQENLTPYNSILPEGEDEPLKERQGMQPLSAREMRRPEVAEQSRQRAGVKPLADRERRTTPKPPAKPDDGLVPELPEDSEVVDQSQFENKAMRGAWQHSMQHAYSPKTEEVRPERSTEAVAKDVGSQMAVAERSFSFGSMPTASQHAMQIARKWQGVPDSIGDVEAINRGIISPDMIMLIMTILNEVMQNCFSSKPLAAWERVQIYNSSRPMDRLADNTRLMWMVDRWMMRTGYPRDRGDVADITAVLTKHAANMREEEFKNVQTELLWLTA
jgi:hypothetical protein